MASALSRRRLPPEIVGGVTPPCQEVVRRGADVDLLRFPILHHHEKDAGPYVTWQVNVTPTSALFTGQPGKTYRFYSVARDQAGNLEDAPASPDATTQVSANAVPTRRTTNDIGPIGTGNSAPAGTYQISVPPRTT